MVEKQKIINKNFKTKKTRVNITLDRDLLDKAKKKIDVFGGKLSTLFNLYLADFVESLDKDIADTNKELAIKVKELEARLKRLEDK
jgi:hypothetical protein